jgi:hypothetical protein
MDKKIKGSWLVHQTGKLQNVNNQSSFENTYFAGKAGILLSAISADKQLVINSVRLEALARASNINTRLELPIYGLLDYCKISFQKLMSPTEIMIAAIYPVS